MHPVLVHSRLHPWGSAASRPDQNAQAVLPPRRCCCNSPAAAEARQVLAQPQAPRSGPSNGRATTNPPADPHLGASAAGRAASFDLPAWTINLGFINYFYLPFSKDQHTSGTPQVPQPSASRRRRTPQWVSVALSLHTTGHLTGRAFLPISCGSQHPPGAFTPPEVLTHFHTFSQIIILPLPFTCAVVALSNTNTANHHLLHCPQPQALRRTQGRGRVCYFYTR